jgi:hypothetical protein
MVDIIIPLGIGSKSNDDELRLLLRSIEKNGIGYNKIIIVATKSPNWLQNVELLQYDDILTQNKDGNIINKVLFALKNVSDISNEFVWTCDDCVILQEFDFSAIPPIFNNRSKKDFSEKGNRWQKRIRRTFDFFEERNFPLKHNYESHVPQRFPKNEVLKAIEDIDYQSDIGYGINTLFFGLLGINGGFDQNLFKVTCEKKEMPSLDKMLLGYNDDGFSVLKNKLFNMFPNKCKYEK